MIRQCTAVLGLVGAIAACGSDEGRTARAADVGNPETTVSNPTLTAAPEEFAPVVVGPVSFADAEASFREKRYEEARARFRAYTEGKPENPWGFYMLGLSAWKDGDHAAAEQALRRAIELDSTHVKAHYNLGRVLMDANRYEEALEIVRRAAELAPESSESFRLLARACDGLGRLDDAFGASKRAIVLNDGDVWALNNLGVLLIRQERFEEALGPLVRAVALDSGVATFHNNLGMALERAGYRAAAAESYRRALAVDGGYGKAAVSLARVEQLSDDPVRPPFDPVAVAQRFLEQVEAWRVEAAEPPAG